MNCKSSTGKIVNQISEVLNTVNSDEYLMPLDLFNGSTIGQHIRHIYDFYNSVVRADESGILDYGERERDPNIETSKEIALQRLHELDQSVQILDESTALKVMAEFDADDSDRSVLESSVGRELMYGYDHAVHHLAIIKMGIKQEFPHYSIDDNIGVAPSTIRYRRDHHSS